MNSNDLNKNTRRKIIELVIILSATMLLIYFLITIYFSAHFLLHTVINGADVSLKAHADTAQIMHNYADNYQLQITEHNGVTEIISGQDIDMKYHESDSITELGRMQNQFQWISSLFKSRRYNLKNTFIYNADYLEAAINKLDCLNKNIIEPRNVSFPYSNGAYKVTEAIFGNKIIRDRLDKAIKINIETGNTKLYLQEKYYYEQPKYTLSSYKTMITKNMLDKYVSASIVYHFGNKKEAVDKSIINKWLSVDDNLDVIIDNAAVAEYIKGLSEKYDTVKKVRKFKTSTDKIVEIKGGLYGWKINQKEETKALIEHIMNGETIEKDPVYSRKAISRDENDIGGTYVEINITKQHLWFYKDGKLVIDGPVVTGNPNNGNATATGVFFLNYKRKNETLSGPGYEAKVTYWMPFYGNMGLHDAGWRSSFGGEIYKSKGTHGCVNAPLNLAKVVYENINVGIPIICYKEQ
jgi:hypothetical protein